MKERDEMVKYVEQEVDRVKGLFSQKEARLSASVTAAREAAEHAAGERSRAVEQLAEARRAAAAAATRVAEAEEGLAAAVQEGERLQGVADAATGRTAAVEAEMRLLLTAFEQEKAASSAKAAQLQAVLQQWGAPAR